MIASNNSFFICCFITYRRWGQSSSYNVAHPACGLKGSTHLSLAHAYEFLSRCRFSTPTPRHPMVEPFVHMSSRFPLRKSKEKCIYLLRLEPRFWRAIIDGLSPRKSTVCMCLCVIERLSVPVCVLATLRDYVNVT